MVKFSITKSIIVVDYQYYSTASILNSRTSKTALNFSDMVKVKSLAKFRKQDQSNGMIIAIAINTRHRFFVGAP